MTTPAAPADAPVGPAYRYRATCLRVVDGDTLVIRVDLGFNCKIDVHARLAGVNAPELHGDTSLAGLASKAQLEDLLRLAELDGPLLVESHKGARSFERWVVDVWTVDGASVARMMVEGGSAVWVDRP